MSLMHSAIAVQTPTRKLNTRKTPQVIKEAILDGCVKTKVSTKHSQERGNNQKSDCRLIDAGVTDTEDLRDEIASPAARERSPS